MGEKSLPNGTRQINHAPSGHPAAPTLLEARCPVVKVASVVLPGGEHRKRLEIARPRLPRLVDRALKRDTVASTVTEHADLLVKVGGVRATRHRMTIVVHRKSDADEQSAGLGKPGEHFESALGNLVCGNEFTGEALSKRVGHLQLAGHRVTIVLSQICSSEKTHPPSAGDEMGQSLSSNTQCRRAKVPN